jgi:uncharacterized membrane protein
MEATRPAECPLGEHHMGLLDAIVSRHFRDDQAGRIVALPVDRRIRGYLVKSESEELKIRAFLKMFYCAEWSLQLVSLLVTIGWITQLTYASGNSIAYHVKSGTTFVGTYALIVVLPYFLLWKTYKKALLSFVSAQDEVAASDKQPRRTQAILAVGIIVAVAIAILVGVFLLIRAK